MFSDILLTVDYDRTLTAPDSSVPERNLEAIRYFIANGGAFTVNTGRSVPMTRVFADIVPVNAPLLLYNGSAAYDPATGELSGVRTIDLNLWDTVRELTAAFPGFTVEVQGIDAHYVFSPNPNWEIFSQNNFCAYATAKPGQDLGPFLKFTLYGQFRENTMADFYVASPEDLAVTDAAEALLREKYGRTCAVFRTTPRIIDVQAKGVSKANSAQELQKRLGRSILVCVGDGENDVPMLSGADFAFSPADGVVADRFENVCRCADGAVAEVIYEKIPEILRKKA